MNYKGKKIEKTLLTSLYIIDVSDKEMKIVSVEGSRYYIQDKDDEISLAQQLAQKGYTISQIVKILNISERKVRKYLEDCW